MSDDTRQQPVAIRVTRPFATPDEFLDHEIETLTRTSITLLGAQPRPKGVILRFEVALSTGTQLLRGEGRVVGFKENAFGDQPGLVLRFTRLDTKSKALVDRAAEIREARARAALQAAMGEDASLPPPGEIVPSSIAPHSIGPMSVMQDVPSPPPVVAAPPTDRGGAFASSPPTRPAPLTAPPAFFTPPAPSEALEAPPPPAQSSSQSFDDAMFAGEDAPTAGEAEAAAVLKGLYADAEPVPAPPAPSARPEPPPVPPPSEPTFAGGAPASRESVRPEPSPAPAPARREPTPPPAPVVAAPRPVSAAPARPKDEGRDALLARLRERSKGLSADRVASLLRR